MTDRTTWQKFERRVAAFFGTKRKPLSGGNSGGGRSDSQHERLFIECKLRAKSPVHRLFAGVEKQAAKEDRVPLLALQEKHYPGWLLVCRPEDIHLLASYAKDYESLPVGEQEQSRQSAVTDRDRR